MGPRGLLYPLPLPTRRNGVIGVDCLIMMGLPLTAQGFDLVQVHVEYLSGEVHAVTVPSRSMDTAANADKHILETFLRSGDGT